MLFSITSIRIDPFDPNLDAKEYISQRSYKVYLSYYLFLFLDSIPHPYTYRAIYKEWPCSIFTTHCSFY